MVNRFSGGNKVSGKGNFEKNIGMLVLMEVIAVRHGGAQSSSLLRKYLKFQQNKIAYEIVDTIISEKRFFRIEI